MKQSARAEALAPPGGDGSWIAGSYEARDGPRIVRAVRTAQHGLCLVDEGPDGSRLIERELQGVAHAEALAADPPWRKNRRLTASRHAPRSGTERF
jgi:hypothetical protein